MFDDPDLEQQAQEICGDDEFCRFDIAATERPEIGMATMMSTQEFDVIANMSVPSKHKDLGSEVAVTCLYV